jgi:hypothetical protein
MKGYNKGSRENMESTIEIHWLGQGKAEAKIVHEGVVRRK